MRYMIYKNTKKVKRMQIGITGRKISHKGIDDRIGINGPLS